MVCALAVGAALEGDDDTMIGGDGSCAISLSTSETRGAAALLELYFACHEGARVGTACSDTEFNDSRNDSGLLRVDGSFSCSSTKFALLGAKLGTVDSRDARALGGKAEPKADVRCKVEPV